jgi:hypothetical protein
MIQPFSQRYYHPWPLLAWKEGTDTDVMAIFKVRNPDAPCSCLLHYGVERIWSENGERWKKSYIAWSVRALEDIEELVVAAWHVAGNVPLPRDHEKVHPPSTDS